MSTVQGLRGKVKKLEINSSRYEINENGVEEINSLKANSVIYLNRKNRIIKQIDIYDNFTNEVKLNYSNGLLMNTISKKTNRIDKAEYKYNKSLVYITTVQSKDSNKEQFNANVFNIP